MLIGHQKQWEILRESLLANSLSHAYLFAGIDSLGKRTFALEFVKLINCQDKKEEKRPCNQCHVCKMISKLSFPDLLFVEPEGLLNDQPSIHILQIRKIQEFLSYRPYLSKFKVVIIDKAEKMNKNAQSCLLKTLEEPKGNTIMILISSHPEALLPTVFSRCELVKFFYVKKEDIKNYLLESEVPLKKAEILTDTSQGRPGKALYFFSDNQKIEEERNFLQKNLEILESDFFLRFDYVNNLISQNNLARFFEILQDYFRFILLKKIGAVDNRFNRFSVSAKKFENYSNQKLKKTIEKIEATNFLISSTNINPKLALELLLMEI